MHHKGRIQAPSSEWEQPEGYEPAALRLGRGGKHGRQAPAPHHCLEVRLGIAGPPEATDDFGMRRVSAPAPRHGPRFDKGARWDPAEVGRTAAGLLLGRIAGSVGAAPQHILLPSEFVARGSIGPPPNRR